MTIFTLPAAGKNFALSGWSLGLPALAGAVFANVHGLSGECLGSFVPPLAPFEPDLSLFGGSQSFELLVFLAAELAQAHSPQIAQSATFVACQ